MSVRLSSMLVLFILCFGHYFNLISALTPSHGRCEPLTVNLCKDMPYNMTTMPNLLGHHYQEDVEDDMEMFSDILSSGYVPHLKYFLCMIYTPVCTALKEPIPPCRDLCTEAHTQADKVNKYTTGFESFWTSKLKCDQFPESGLCIPLDSLETELLTEPPASLDIYNGSIGSGRGGGVVGGGGDTGPVSDGDQQNGSIKKSRCEPLRVSVCKNLQLEWSKGQVYRDEFLIKRTTLMPNALGQNSQTEISNSLRKYAPIIESGCSPYFKMLLCSLYTPDCYAGFGHKILYPCRRVCTESKKQCESQMMTFLNTTWPDELDCDQFPQKSCARLPKISQISHVEPLPTLGQNNETVGIDNDGEPAHEDGDKLVKNDTNSGRCEPVLIPACWNMPYNMTSVPNMLNHESQKEAHVALWKYSRLIKSGCSKHLNSFLCVLYAPSCSKSGKAIPPCRRLCRKVMSHCKPQSKKTLGVRWPVELQCSQFPKQGLCFGLEDINKVSPPQQSTSLSGDLGINGVGQNTNCTDERRRDKSTVVADKPDLAKENNNSTKEEGSAFGNVTNALPEICLRNDDCKSSDNKAFFNGLAFCCPEGRHVAFFRSHFMGRTKNKSGYNLIKGMSKFACKCQAPENKMAVGIDWILR